MRTVSSWAQGLMGPLYTWCCTLAKPALATRAGVRLAMGIYQAPTQSFFLHKRPLFQFSSHTFVFWNS